MAEHGNINMFAVCGTGPYETLAEYIRQMLIERTTVNLPAIFPTLPFNGQHCTEPDGTEHVYRDGYWWEVI